MSSSRRPPLLIVGLDGADWQVLRALFAQRRLPHLAGLAAAGLCAPLRSTLPIATLPAWTSFLTGCEPAVHGVADMLVRTPSGLRPASGALRQVPTFLCWLAAEGLAVASLGMPGTYPPEPTGGLCVAGFDAPGAAAAGPDAVWPRSFYGELQRLGGWRYATFNEHRPGSPGQHRRACAALLADLEIKERVALAVLRRRPWDVFCVHLQASDTVGHHLWHTFDPASPRHRPGWASDALPQVYARLDALIGRLRASLPATARTLVVSDHGMGGASDVAVHLNRLAHAHGALQFVAAPSRRRRAAVGRALRQGLRALPAGSMGLALRALPPAVAGGLLAAARGTHADPARSLFTSDELDYAPSLWACDGADPAATAAAAQRLVDALLALRHPRSGAALVAAVHRRADLPGGPWAGRLPDLVVEPAWPDGYRPSFLPSPGPGDPVRLLPPSAFAAPRGAGMPGAHRREGVFIAAGAGLSAASLAPLDIAAAGAAVYALVGARPPAAVQARLPRALAALLRPPATAAAGRGDPPGDDDSDGDSDGDGPYSGAQRAALLQRLDAMGYL